MEGRVEILPEKMGTFSVILIKFPTYEKVVIFPKSKKLILEDEIVLNDVETKIIQCRIGKKLIIEIDGDEIYETELDILQIKVKR